MTSERGGTMIDEGRLFDLREHLPRLARTGGGRRVIVGLESVLGFPRIRCLIDDLEEKCREGGCPFATLLDLAGIPIDGEGVAEAMPREGAVVVVCNHPLGGADALAASMLALRARPDTRIIANAEALRIKPLAPHLIPFSIMEQEGAERENIRQMRVVLDHLGGGGSLVVFPAGAVERWQSDLGRVAELPWSPHIARMILKAKAQVLPVRFFGGNPDWFHFLGAVHPLVRSALIPRAFLAQKGKVVRCRAGRLFTPGEFPATPGEMTRQLRERLGECSGN